MSLNLRLPEALHRELQQIATGEDRSLNAQLTRFLREAVRRYRREHPDAEADDLTP